METNVMNNESKKATLRGVNELYFFEQTGRWPSKKESDAIVANLANEFLESIPGMIEESKDSEEETEKTFLEIISVFERGVEEGDLTMNQCPLEILKWYRNWCSNKKSERLVEIYGKRIPKPS
jgi:hypothetical protein